MKKRAVFVMIVLTVIAVVVIAGLRMYNKPHQSIDDAEVDFRISTRALVDAFVQDESAANQHYGGKVLLVTGPVREVMHDGTTPILMLGDSTDAAGISCYLDEEEGRDAANLLVGERVAVKGICHGMLLDVVLDQARVVKGTTSGPER